MRPSLIGLTGHMGAGKDAAAAMLHMVGYDRVALADAVRAEVHEAMEAHGWPQEAFEYFGSGPNRIQLRKMTAAEVWLKPTTQSMRMLLQWWGTEYRRKQDPNYWVDRVMSETRGRCCVVSDVRFRNEAEAIRQHGGVVWKISRDVRDVAPGIPGHQSETEIGAIAANLLIQNNGHLIDMADQIRKALQ